MCLQKLIFYCSGYDAHNVRAGGGFARIHVGIRHIDTQTWEPQQYTKTVKIFPEGELSLCFVLYTIFWDCIINLLQKKRVQW